MVVREERTNLVLAMAEIVELHRLMITS